MTARRTAGSASEAAQDRQGAQVPSMTFAFSEMNSDSLAQLHAVLAEVEKGRGTLVRLAGLMGGAVGQAVNLGLQGLSLTPGLQEKIQAAAEEALRRTFNLAIVGMGGAQSASLLPSQIRENMVQAAVAVSGAVGGFGGFLSMAPDIGFTTLAIMREIAEIARENGEDLSTEDARRACLEVFALRSFATSRDSEEKELGFFAARSMLRGQPLVLLMAEVAGHYGLGLSRKLAAQMIPVAGALCGASLNAAFLTHYRAVARAHFTIRRLERQHGAAVREAAEAYRGTAAEAVFE
ncbi:EcsC family protein [Oecophyllibacter saccharovorans]|uniref:EcsC family protein n=1 Tax=Oecophyllibacter saccharovorans TaxID=2558360 RepID=UPI001170F65C|nr:EcsC family protein [Oecophyllibacter saccharovorans]TPW36508.1 hypothetical protein E3203_01695 [Oecophyllibacter saccharovorans]